MDDAEPEVIHLNNRLVRFWRDESPFALEEQNRRLDVPLTDEEYGEFANRLLQLRPTTPAKLVVRIPSTVRFTPPSGPVDLTIWIKPWRWKEHTGAVAYLQRCVPTKTKQEK